MALHKTAKIYNSDLLGYRDNLFAVINFPNYGQAAPLILTDRYADIELINGLEIQGQAGFGGMSTKSNVLVNSSGNLQLVPLATSGYAMQVYDLGYPPDFRMLTLAGDIPTGGKIEVYIRTAASIDDLSSATWYGPFVHGDNLHSEVPPARYMEVGIYLTATSDSPELYRFFLEYNTQLQEEIVIDWGTISVELTDCLAPALPSYQITVDNSEGQFSRLLARLPISGMELSIIRAPAKALPREFQVIYTGIIKKATAGSTGTIYADGTKIDLLRRYPRLTTKHFGLEGEETYLPAYFGKFDKVYDFRDLTEDFKYQEEKKRPSAKDIKITVYPDCKNTRWRFVFDAEKWKFECVDADGTSYGSYKPNRTYIIKDSAGAVMFKIIMTIYHPENLQDKDSFSFRTISGGEARTIKIGETLDGITNYCLSIWSCKVNALYDDNGIIDESNYTIHYNYAYQGRYRISYVTFPATFTPTGDVYWAGEGIQLNGKCAENPAEILRAIFQYNPSVNDYLFINYFDEGTYYNAKAKFDEWGIKFKGELPAAEMTYTEIAQRLMQYIADIDVSEGRIRLLPITYEIDDDTQDISQYIHWRDLMERPEYSITPVDKIQNSIEMNWGSKFAFGEDDARQEVTVEDEGSINLYGRLIGFGRSKTIKIEAPYAYDEAVAKSIGLRWLYRHRLPWYRIRIVVPGLGLSVVELGDTHIVVSDRYGADISTRTLGTVDQRFRVEKREIDLQGRTVTLEGIIFKRTSVNAPLPLRDPQPLSFDSDDAIWDYDYWT